MVRVIVSIENYSRNDFTHWNLQFVHSLSLSFHKFRFCSYIHFIFYFFFFALFLSFFPFPFLFPIFTTLFHFRFRCGILCDDENQMRIKNDININIGPFSLVPLYPPFNRTFDAETIADLNLRDMKTTALNSISSTEKKTKRHFLHLLLSSFSFRSFTNTRTHVRARSIQRMKSFLS